MRVLKGGSAEVKPNKWLKFDLELDESDLQTLIVTHKLAELSVIQKYSLLVKQAELLITVQMESDGVVGDKTSRELLTEFNALLDKLPKVV